MNLKERLVELLNIHGTSGNEKAVRDYLFPILKDSMDAVEIDPVGNLLASKSYGNGGATVLLSAHMDTVHKVRSDKTIVEKDGIFTAKLPDGSSGVLGADDRAGIAIILEVIKSVPAEFDGVLKIAFSVQEETGCMGAELMSEDFYKDVNLAIVVDRQGNNDIVVGNYTPFCNTAVGDYMKIMSKFSSLSYECVEGGVSDALTFSSKGINSVNLSAGYQNEHTDKEFVSIHNMSDTVKLIQTSLSYIGDYYQLFGEVPEFNKWINNQPYRGLSWYQEGDFFGDVIGYMEGDEVVLQQGVDRITMSIFNFKSLSEKIIESVDNR